MICDLSIQNFRSFKDFSADGFGRVNLIVGKNNSGKTSLLEAGYWLASGRPSAVYDLFHFRDEVMAVTPGQHPRSGDSGRTFGEASVASLFNGHSSKEKGIVVKSDAHNSVLLEARVIPLEMRDGMRLFGSEVEKKLEVKLGDQENLIRVFRDERTPVYDDNSLQNSPGSVQLISAQGLSVWETRELWDQITLTPGEQFVNEMMGIVSDVKRVNFIGGTSSLSEIVLQLNGNGANGNGSRVPMSSMGTGLYRIFSLACAMAVSQNGTLFVDEIDTAFHYRALVQLWRVLLTGAREHGVQVFATTHSYDCIRAYAEALESQNCQKLGSLHRLTRRGEGIEAVRYDADELLFAIQHDVEVR